MNELTVNLLVMLSCNFKFPQKDISIPQVAVSPSLCRTVAKFLCYEQTLHKERYRKIF